MRRANPISPRRLCGGDVIFRVLPPRPVLRLNVLYTENPQKAATAIRNLNSVRLRTDIFATSGRFEEWRRKRDAIGGKQRAKKSPHAAPVRKQTVLAVLSM